ncbi:hypothetical protein [Bordetella genomosp. 1]|nr:hypothetical protein [Bordetella genomosp. 1]
MSDSPLMMPADVAAIAGDAVRTGLRPRGDAVANAVLAEGPVCRLLLARTACAWGLMPAASAVALALS